jgi:thiol-disulfide isomerase/thioredoxin
MSLTASTMLPLGTTAFDFSLPDPAAGGKKLSLSDIADNHKGFLLVFLANHCPYAQHVLKLFPAFAKEYQKKGLGVAAISASDSTAYPDDAPDKMAELSKAFSFTFPYLFDEDQVAAKAYRAACTPDFFLFDAKRALVYRGRFDESSPGNNRPLTGNDLRIAVEALLDGRQIPDPQKPAMGCSIKWKPGNEPDYYKS